MDGLTAEDIEEATKLLQTHKDGAFGGILQSLSLNFDALLTGIRDDHLRRKTYQFIQSDDVQTEPMIVTPQPLHSLSTKPSSQ